jgi:glycerate dehydrogenase
LEEKTMYKMVVLDAITLGEDIDLSIIKRFGNLEVYWETDEDKIFDRINNADIVISNKIILKDILNRLDSLKLICLMSTGTNVVDLAIAKERKIAVTNVAGYSTSSVAQHTFGMFFYLYEKLRYFDDYVKEGSYIKSNCFTHFGRTYNELAGKKWGIVGLGEIGKKVASIAEVFGAEVIYYSTTGKNNSSKYRRVEKDILLKESDVISIHAPLNELTQNLIAMDDFVKMKREAVLLNMGRGGIVNERDLARALNEGLISCAGLDVLENEPMSEHSPLLQISDKDKILITPHIAWASVEARQRLINEVAQNIEAFIKGEKRNRVC